MGSGWTVKKATSTGESGWSTELATTPPPGPSPSTVFITELKVTAVWGYRIKHKPLSSSSSSSSSRSDLDDRDLKSSNSELDSTKTRRYLVTGPEVSAASSVNSADLSMMAPVSMTEMVENVEAAAAAGSLAAGSRGEASGWTTGTAEVEDGGAGRGHGDVGQVE